MKIIFIFIAALGFVCASRADDIDQQIVSNLDFFMNLNLIKTKEMLELIKPSSDLRTQNNTQTVSGDLNHESK